MHWIIATLNLCDYVVYITRFSCETFGVLIALIYIYTGIYSVIKYYTDDEFSSALLQTFIAVGAEGATIRAPGEFAVACGAASSSCGVLW